MTDAAGPSQAGEMLIVRSGSHVTIELVDETGASERLELNIVPDSQADYAHGFLGEGTPLARAIWDQPAGAIVPYKQADIVAVRILEVKPSGSARVADMAREREESMRKAVAEVERRDAILFASSFSGKWGDYDPSGMEHWEGEDESKTSTTDAQEGEGKSKPTEPPA
jgi:hypothetical protein